MTFGRRGSTSLTLIALRLLSACHSDTAGAPSEARESGAGGLVDAGLEASGANTGEGDDTGTSGGPDGLASGTPEAGAGAAGAVEGGTVTEAGAAGSWTGPGGNDASAGNPCAARPGLLFCDTFESSTATPEAPWSTSIIGTGTVTVDSTTPAHSGTKSVHISDGDADYDTLLVLHDASVLPAPAGRFYIRAFVRLGAAMSAGHNAFILADLFASSGQGNNLRLGEDNQMLMYTVMGDAHGALSNANYYSDGMLPGVQFDPDTWTCLEVLLDSNKPEIDVWVAGVEIPDLHHTDYPLDDYDDVRFGFEKYAGPAMDLWYDDIAVGTQPIGCN
jgi:hypothetical protein